MTTETPIFRDHPDARLRFFQAVGVELDADGFPILTGYVDTDNLSYVSVFCPYCQIWHHHGTGGAEAVAEHGISVGDGHREAHCTDPDSPFVPSGYVVKAVKFGNKSDETTRPTGCLVCGKRLRKQAWVPRRPYHARCRDEFIARYTTASEEQ